jgi:long-chain acyl-CoA synthetase
MVGLTKHPEKEATDLNTSSQEKGVTWPQVLKYNSERYGGSVAMQVKHYGIWQPVTWQEYYTKVKTLSLGLLTLGFQPGEKLMIIGDNAPQWYYSELAAQANHGIAIGVYSDLSAMEIADMAINSNAAYIVVEDQEQADKVMQIKDKLPSLKKIIFWQFKGLASYKEPLLISIKEVVHKGEELDQQNSRLFLNNVVSGKAEDPCAIIYTSGTTGSPKGAIHTYASLMYGAEQLLAIDPLTTKDKIACFLPPAWIMEQLLYVGCHLLSGCILNIAESVETQQQDMREIGPDLVYYGARQWENQARTVQARIQGAGFIKNSAFRFFMPAGYYKAKNEFIQKKYGAWHKVAYLAADWLMLRPIRDSLGLPHTRICYTSGQTLSQEAFRFYHAIGIPLKSVFSTTEGGILAITNNGEFNPEYIGKLASGAEVGITKNGEIVYRQPGMFAGYFNLPEKTRQSVKDGWFHSGDTGSISEDGQLIFYDRKDDIIEFDGGDTVSPQSIESRLKYNPYIRDAWVIANANSPIVAAVIVIDYNNVGKWAGRNKLAYTTFSDLSQKPDIYSLIHSEIQHINQDALPHDRISKFVNLHKEFDTDEGELTKDRKLRRFFLMERYQELVEAIFNGKSEAALSFKLQYRDGRTGIMNTNVAIKDVEEAEK